MQFTSPGCIIRSHTTLNCIACRALVNGWRFYGGAWHYDRALLTVLP